jgi:uncharacterized protein (AIM24 family)
MIVEVLHDRVARITVDDVVWIKRGTVVAYEGALRFHRERVWRAEKVRQAAGPVRSALMREASPFSRAVGRGCLYVSDAGQFVRLVDLAGERLHVVAPHLLAIAPTLTHEPRFAGTVGVLSGMHVITISGHGIAAISTPAPGLTLPVAEDSALSTDPHATVAWSDGLWPELQTDFDAGSIVGHGGGEPIQMRFRGNGRVIVSAGRADGGMARRVFRQVASSLGSVFV